MLKREKYKYVPKKTLEVKSNVKCKNTNMSQKKLRRPTSMLKCKKYKYVPKNLGGQVQC